MVAHDKTHSVWEQLSKNSYSRPIYANSLDSLDNQKNIETLASLPLTDWTPCETHSKSPLVFAPFPVANILLSKETIHQQKLGFLLISRLWDNPLKKEPHQTNSEYLPTILMAWTSALLGLRKLHNTRPSPALTREELETHYDTFLESFKHLLNDPEEAQRIWQTPLPVLLYFAQKNTLPKNTYLALPDLKFSKKQGSVLLSHEYCTVGEPTEKWAKIEFLTKIGHAPWDTLAYPIPNSPTVLEEWIAQNDYATLSLALKTIAKYPHTATLVSYFFPNTELPEPITLSDGQVIDRAETLLDHLIWRLHCLKEINSKETSTPNTYPTPAMPYKFKQVRVFNATLDAQWENLAKLRQYHTLEKDLNKGGSLKPALHECAKPNAEELHHQTKTKKRL